jgi:hypothetical protein
MMVMVVTNWLTKYVTPWLQNPQVHHHVHKSPPPVPILSQLDPLSTSPAILPKIHSDPILPSTSWSSTWSPSLWLSHQNLVHFLLLSHACHMSRASRSPWFDLPNNIWGWVQNMKLGGDGKESEREWKRVHKIVTEADVIFLRNLPKIKGVKYESLYIEITGNVTNGKIWNSSSR